MAKPGALRLCVVALLVSIACESETQSYGDIGSPLPQLSEQELGRFRQGEALFNRVFSTQEGLGPLFNENQCSACHTFPAAGGTGEQLLVKATRFEPPDRCDPLTEEGGQNVRTQATSLLRAHGIDRQPFPNSATERGRFTAPFLFGLGLVESIPEDQITQRADPDDRNRDGISGRVGRDANGKFARFGRKSEFANLADFVDGALRFEMGLTTTRRPTEESLAGQSFPKGTDPAPDPEIDDRIFNGLVDFVRFLAPPSRRAAQNEREHAMIARGEEVFRLLGCAACHVPAMRTGKTELAALDRKRIFLYSDLLLHDLGPKLADVCGIVATPSELRTAMLMGIARRKVFLHDGRTLDLSEAILLHGGEAEASSQRFRRLDRVAQEALLQFLRTL